MILEEYLQNDQSVEELQINNKTDINIISYLNIYYKKLFYSLKKNNFLYFMGLIIAYHFLCIVIICLVLSWFLKNCKKERINLCQF